MSRLGNVDVGRPCHQFQRLHRRTPTLGLIDAGPASRITSSAMTEHTDKVTIKDGGQERLVKVFIETPSLDGLDIQSLAQEAWFRPGRMLRRGDVTVIVAKFKR
jgi:hypothetical protein